MKKLFFTLMIIAAGISAAVAQCTPGFSEATTICVGQTTQLSGVTLTDGIWISNSPNVASVTNTGTVTGLAGGTATFTFIDTIAHCQATTSEITINSTVTPSVSIAITTGANPTCAGSGITFTATPVNGGTPSYQWKVNGTNAGTTNSSTFNYSTPANNAKVTCEMTSTVTCVTATKVTSNEITVTVKNAPTAPTGITGTTTICSGNSTTLTATGGGDGDGATYEWGTGNCGSNKISDQTGVSIIVSPTTTTTYWVRRVGTAPCSNSTGCAATIEVKVNTVPAQPGTISGNPTLCSGTTQTYSVNNATGVTYNWQLPTGWAQTEGGTTNSIKVTAGATAGTITVTPSNSCGNGQARTFTVTTVNLPPSITTQPNTANKSKCLGDAFSAISVDASGTAPLSYQWYSNTTANNSGGTSLSNAHGAQTASYTPQSTTGGALYYYCIVTNSCSTTTSNVSEIHTVILPPSITTQPNTATQSKCLGETFSAVSVVAPNVAALSYQWYSNTTAKNSGGTSLGNVYGAQSASYTPQSTTVRTLYYYCIVTNGCGDDTSNISGAQTIKPLPTVSITGQNPVCANQKEIVYKASSPNNITYQWEIDNTGDITSSTHADSVTVNWKNAETEREGILTITVRSNDNGCENTVSQPIAISSNTAPDVETITGKINKDNETYMLIYPNPKNQPLAYQWYKNDAIIAGATEQYFYPQNYGQTFEVNAKYTVRVAAESNQLCANITKPYIFKTTKSNEKALTISPNPVNNGKFTVSFGDVELSGNNTLIVTGLDSKQLWQQLVTSLDEIPVNLTLTSGIYFVTLKTGKNQTYTEKIIVP